MNNRRLVCLTISLAMLSLLASNGSAAEPKKLLVVTVTTGFRHSSIPMAEKVLAELAEKSKRFTVDYVREPRPRPKRPAEPKPMPNEADEAFKARKQAFDQEMETVKKADAVWLAEVTQVLAEKMSPSALANYDGVVFANTTGDLPLPDKDAFVAWIRSGRGFIGTHSATDTFHNYKPYLEMIGGEFDGHPWHQPVTVRNEKPEHKVVVAWGSQFEITDEIYQFKTYSRSDKEVLLSLDPTNADRPRTNARPGEAPLGFFERGKRADRDYAVAWIKPYGDGRVFYTSLGHRDEVWLNPTFQQHLLAGIDWALNLSP